jgi:DNA-binding response OmpR family regulator
MGQAERKRYTVTLDDDPTIHLIIQQATGMPSLPFTSVEALLARSTHYSPVAVFVDIFLGTEGNGLEAIPLIREQWRCPIIVITANAETQHIGQALSLGAQDFMVKPLQRQELLARLVARLAEAAEQAEKSEQRVGDVVYISKRRLIQNGSQECYLAPFEALIFEALIEAKGVLMTKNELCCKVWGNIKVSPGALEKKIFAIRKALLYLHSRIEIRAEYGKGIRLVVPKETATRRSSNPILSTD